MNNIPLALYVHIPWCVRKCPYCDFNSHQDKAMDEQAYVQALLEDLQQDQALAQGREIDTLFFGGGTPSLFKAESFDFLLQQIHNIVTIKSNAEITLEANPGTFEYEKFKAYREVGINRLSVGVQSFNQQKLQSLGRIHNSQEAINAISTAREVGFEKLNIDLMHGLPDQNQAQALADLEQALALQPSHLSWYQLTIEPNTQFYSKPPILPEEDTLWEIEQSGKALLKQHGFIQYETSAYSQPEQQCRHNINYWQFGDYLAIGAGAHGKITDPQSKTIQRFHKTRLPQDYLNKQKDFCSKSQIIQPQELAFEFFMNAFRLHRPINKSLFSERSFLPLSSVQNQLQRAQELGLISQTEEHWQTTEMGNRFLNSLLQLFS